MNVNFRSLARSAAARARVELDSGNDERLIYAALELRKAMEGLVYERVYAYREEVPDRAFVSWQPRQLLKVLLEIDAEADHDVTFAIKLDAQDTNPQTMEFVAKEMVLKSRTIKQHYDALGAYLHLPTIASALEGKYQNLNSLRERCDAVIREVDDALSSRMFNMIKKVTCDIICLRCNKNVAPRIPPGVFNMEVACDICKASYQVKSADNNQIAFSPLKGEINCLNDGCDGTHTLWKSDWAEGTTWDCVKCGTTHTIVIEVRALVPRNSAVTNNDGSN